LIHFDTGSKNTRNSKLRESLSYAITAKRLLLQSFIMSGALPSSTIACPGCKNSIPAEGVERGSWLVCPKCNMRFLVSGGSLKRNSDDDEVFDMETPDAPIHSIPSLAPLEIPFVPVRSEVDLPRSEAE
jgi:hypothetical protein